MKSELKAALFFSLRPRGGVLVAESNHFLSFKVGRIEIRAELIENGFELSFKGEKVSSRLQLRGQLGGKQLKRLVHFWLRSCFLGEREA